MALLDRERNLIVLRIVYDGPPEAGKTTSLRALAGSLGQEVSSPAERDGRTLYFDWMEYTGGRFEGYQIRCQIVSVPGQRELAQRRRHLLRDADVVVFVADSARALLHETTERLRELPHLVAAAPPPALGILLQANKRDLPDAVPLVELRAIAAEAGGSIGVVESIAADGTGIREAFVLAVRLALDRVREQLRTGTLAVGRPAIDSSAALLDEIERHATHASVEAPAAPLLRLVLAENDERVSLAGFAPWREPSLVEAAVDGPWPPDPSAPSGSIWPPVDGRLVLQEACATPMTTHRLRGGGWAAGIGNGWRAFSSGEAEYDDLEAGRATLIRLARQHAAAASVLSRQRCIVLAATGRGTWRLWQIVRAERSLRDELDDLARCSNDEAAARILDAAAMLSDIGERLQAVPIAVPCSLDTVGRDERGAIYIGLMPMEGGGQPTDTRSAAQLGRELEAVLRGSLWDRRAEVLASIARSSGRGLTGGGDGLIRDLLAHGAPK